MSAAGFGGGGGGGLRRAREEEDRIRVVLFKFDFSRDTVDFLEANVSGREIGLSGPTKLVATVELTAS